MTDTEDFIITRTVDAPRALVWKMWSDPVHLSHWWGPKGLSLRVGKLEFKPGGMFHYAMGSPDGKEMWGRFVYGDIVAPEKIVFINSFADAEGNVIRAPFSPVWPLEVHNTLTLEERDGKTVVTLRGYPLNASEIELQTFKAMHQSMRMGFGGTFDQLDAYIATQKEQ